VTHNEDSVRDLAYRPFERLGVPYLHPGEIAGQVTQIRHTKVLDIRETLVRDADTEEQLRRQEQELNDLKQRRDVQQSERLSLITAKVPHAPQVAGEASRRNHARYEKLVEQTDPAAAKIASSSGRAAVADDSPSDPARPDRGGPTAFDTATAAAEARNRMHTGAAPAPAAPPPSTHRGSSLGPPLRDGCNVVALYTYTATDGDELSFNRGEEFLCVTRAVDDGWFIGVHQSKQGVFPANYVKALN
jgi:hypothetical protein